MAKYEQRVVLQRLVGKHLLIASVLYGSQRRQHAAQSFCEKVLCTIAFVDGLPGSHLLESMPVGSHERVDRQVLEFE